MKKTFFFIIFCCLMFSESCLAWTGSVAAIKEGAVLSIIQEETGEIIQTRLYGIETPECPRRERDGQPFCHETAAFINNAFPRGAQVSVINLGFDAYNREIYTIVSLPDGKVLQEELLKEGLAWVYPEFCYGCTQWTELQNRAKAGKKGLWSEPDPVSPWDFRKGRAAW